MIYMQDLWRDKTLDMTGKNTASFQAGKRNDVTRLQFQLHRRSNCRHVLKILPFSGYTAYLIQAFV
jgi:hypothetical protein